MYLIKFVKNMFLSRFCLLIFFTVSICIGNNYQSNAIGYYGGGMPSSMTSTMIEPGMSPDMMNSYYNGSYYSGGGHGDSLLNWFMPSQIVLEPYVYAHYNLSSANYIASSGGAPYVDVFNKTIPASFGVALGLRINSIFLVEFDITGAKDSRSFSYEGQGYSQRTNLVFLRFNLGISIPLSIQRYRGRSMMESVIMSHHDRRINILILGGFMTLIRNVTFSSLPPSVIGTTIGVLPEIGGGFEYWLNTRFGLRTSIRYAFAGTDPVVKSLLTFDVGVQFKL